MDQGMREGPVRMDKVGHSNNEPALFVVLSITYFIMVSFATILFRDAGRNAFVLVLRTDLFAFVIAST